MPDAFFRRECATLGITLPAAGEYGAALVFLPRDPVEREKVRAIVQSVVTEEGQRFLGWREVPTDSSHLGATARSVEPHISQMFVGRGAGDRRSRRVRALPLRPAQAYRDGDRRAGLAAAEVLLHPEPQREHVHLQGHAQRGPDRADVPRPGDPAVESALALVHQRFSTNTFRRGHWLIHIATWRTTARSTPSEATSTGCGPVRRSAARSFWATI
jgi:hypothetical protein